MTSPSQGTSPSQFRLTPADKLKLAAIREYYGLPSASSAVRFAIGRLHDLLPPQRKSPEKPSEGG